MPYGWGTGGIQLTASVIGESDVLKVIDQGADDTTNAVSIRNFFKRVTGVNTTERTDDATLIQTRHRIPETPLTEDQIVIFQVPIPEPLRFIEPRETETRTMHVGGREMPMPYGWGTGGIQLTASVIGESDVLKVIDQGADDTTNAVSIRNFFKRVTGVNTTERTDDATLIQTRHRIPETPLTEDQIVIFQVPIPEPLRFIEPRETETRTMHAREEYGVMQVKLYEDIARFGHIATTDAYPVKVNGRNVMDPSPIPICLN